MKTEDVMRDYSQHPLYRALHHFWHPVAYSAEVTDAPLKATLLDQDLALARIDGKVIAVADRCAHRGAALSLGRIVDGCFECPYHGWRYDSQGACVKIPANDALTAVMKPKIASYPVTESAGIIWVCLDQNPAFGAPTFPEYSDPAYRLVRGPTYDWETSAPRRLENFVDFSHFAFVHDGSIGSRSSPEVEPVEPRREGHVLAFDRPALKEPQLPEYRAMLGIKHDNWISVDNEYRVTMPHTVHLHRHYEGDNHYVLFMAAAPVSATRTRSYWWIARNFGVEPQHDAYFLKFEAGVLTEDKPIIESQRPKLLPLIGDEARLELPVRGADAVTLAYRRWLMEIVREHGEKAETSAEAKGK
jgi:methylxanthine N1-demethylase